MLAACAFIAGVTWRVCRAQARYVIDSGVWLSRPGSVLGAQPIQTCFLQLICRFVVEENFAGFVKDQQ